MSVLLPVEGLEPPDPQTSSSLYQTFYSKFQRNISTKMKSLILKTVSQKNQPKTNLPKTWVYTNHSNFPQELSGLYKLHILFFFLADYVDEYFRLSLGNIFLRAFFPMSFFLGQGKNIPGKKSLNKNSSKVRRNTSPRAHLSKT